MIKSLIPLACLSLAAVPVAVLAGDTHGAMNPETIKWAPAEGLPKGAQMAVLQGDPSKAGIFTIRLKAPANYKVPAHWHSTEESVTVISGTLYMGDGDKIDTAKAKAVKAGGFMQVPAKAHHYAFAKVPTVIQVTAEGPFDINWIDPKDDPAKSQ